MHTFKVSREVYDTKRTDNFKTNMLVHSIMMLLILTKVDKNNNVTYVKCK